MTELEHVEIEGFKGLEHVEFEPTDINLITGRNNTGKTSFLEAITTLFNPKYVQGFANNIDSLVNIRYDESTIHGELDESNLKISLKSPDLSEVRRWFIEVSPHIVDFEVYESFQLRFDENTGRFESLSEKFSDPVRDIIEEEVTEKDVENIQSEFLVIQSENGKFPYFSAGNGSQAIIENKTISERLQKELGDKIREQSGSEAVEQTSLDKWSDNYQTGTPIKFVKRDGFLSQPPTTKNVNFIESTDLTDGIQKTEGEKDAVKIDDIGDFIRENEIVDNLKTLTSNSLVFEENGGKNQIPYEFMGDGFKTIVGLLWELLDDEVENDVVLIEEPETHMHPGYIREVVYFLIDLAREEDVQLFITTHDSDFINDFFTENLTDEEESYLEDEFSLLRMEEDSSVVEDYETARENLKDLHLDLRGI